MLKKSTKITSLVVAAATVATMVPAMAAEKIADKDGTIYGAVAYKDGKFYVDGDDIENANDNDGVYYLDGGKYSDVDDIDSGDEITNTYGTKYVEIEDGDYYLDLETGKVTDDQIAKDDAEDAASELRKKIRKDDPSRYDENLRDQVADVDDFYTNTTTGDIIVVPGAKFAEPYYEVTYLKEDDSDNWNYTVYTDKNGKYVDADNDLGKLNLIITDNDADIIGAIAAANANGVTTADAVSFIDKLVFDEVGSKKTDENNKADRKEYKVEILKNSSYTLGSDEKYIYRTVGLQISYCADPYNSDGTEKDDNDKVFNVMKAAFFGSEKNPNLVQAAQYKNLGYAFPVVQRISKEQGDDKDGAKLPKSTETYLINEYKDFKLKEDFAEAKNDFYKYGHYTIADGKLTNFGYNNSDEKFGAVTFKFSSKNGSYYLDQDDTDMDVDDSNEDDWDLDKDGNLWYMNSGKIYKYDNKGNFGSAVYKVDGGFDELSVYDDKNLIAYNEDDDTYAIVGGKSSTGEYEVKDEETTTDTTTTAQAGWVQDATTGAWSYVKADGTKAIGWFQSPTSGLWYYMDANGVMQANGWIQDGGSWYYLKADGAMATGWVYTGGAWYFLKNTAGNMGAMQTGWIQTGGKWYYCNASGAMLSNTTVDGYVLGADGAWIK